MNRKSTLQESIGWFGAFAILVAYALVSSQVIDVTSQIYQLLNLIGALGIVYISILKRAYQPAVLNIIWAFVAIASLIRILI